MRSDGGGGRQGVGIQAFYGREVGKLQKASAGFGGVVNVSEELVAYSLCQIELFIHPLIYDTYTHSQRSEYTVCVLYGCILLRKVESGDKRER